MKRPAIALSVLMAAIVVLADQGEVPAQPSSQDRSGTERMAGALNSREAREVARILAQFRRAKGVPEKRAEALEEAVAWGPGAVSALSQVISKEMQPTLEKYRARFYEQAAKISRNRLGKADPAEIVGLRGTVLALSKSPDLTKEMIETKADPALKRLTEIFVVDRLEVLESAAGLQDERQKLLAAGDLWEQCAQSLHETLPEGADKPEQPPSFEEYLEGEEELAVGLAAPMAPATQAILKTNVGLSKQLDPEESRAILALNLMRNLLGLNPLVIDPKLCAAARDHSKDMETLKFFAHDSPVSGKKTPWDRAARFGTSAGAENIFVGSQDGAQANLAWFHSPGHHKNMLGAHNRVGMGRSGVYFTQMLGK